jgi:hypothetical protein
VELDEPGGKTAAVRQYLDETVGAPCGTPALGILELVDRSS